MAKDRSAAAAFGAVVLLVLAAGACSSGADDHAAAPPAPQANDGPGAIVGRIRFAGTPPPRQPLKMSADPQCVAAGGPALSEAVLVDGSGGLQNVFVYIKDGLGTRTYPTPSRAVVLDQQGCRYEPRVFGVQVGQPVEIRNGDPTLHNVHARPAANQPFNIGQPMKGMTSARTFDAPEVMVPIRCDVHGWMNAYAGVLPHPFFAVTKADGTFAISGLAPGTYTIEAWHEELGTQTQTVTVGDADATADFTFAPTT